MRRHRALLIAALAIGAAMIPSPASAADPACDTYAPPPTGVEQTRALQRWIDRTPNGTSSGRVVMCLRPGTYIVNGQLRLVRRSWLHIRGMDRTILHATQFASTTGEPSCQRSMWRISRSSAITFRGFVLAGYNSRPGTYTAGCEWQHSFEILGGSWIDIGSTSVWRNKGDCLYVGAVGTDLADHISYHDSVCGNIGRSGVSVVGGQFVTVERVLFKDAAMVVFNMEPNLPDQGAFDVQIRDTEYTGKGVQWLGLGGHGPIRRILLENNRSRGSWGLYTYGWSPGQPRSDIVVRNNDGGTRDVSHGTGGRMFFTHVDRLTVTGNIIPGVGNCVRAVYSTAVEISGNSPC